MVAHPSTQSTYQERRGHRVLMTRSLLANKGNDNSSQRIETVDQKKKGDSSSSLASHFRIAQPYLQYHPCNLLYVNLRIPHTVTGAPRMVTADGYCKAPPFDVSLSSPKWRLLMPRGCRMKSRWADRKRAQPLSSCASPSRLESTVKECEKLILVHWPASWSELFANGRATVLDLFGM